MGFSAGVWITILTALAFDFINGFHDAANSIATVVSTRVLSPRIAVVWAGFFNFAAFAVFGVVLGAVIWNLITWWLGLPTSSSHALIGGFVGAAWISSGPHAVITSGLV